MMLAFYLAAPEFENDRRELKIIHGMRRARKEGRYPKEIQPNILRWAFNQIADGIFNTEQVYKMAKEKRAFLVQTDFFGLQFAILCIAVKFYPKNTRMKNCLRLKFLY